MTDTSILSKQQVGKLGELFIQYRFLQFGVESAHLTTDAGIDLVAYSPRRPKPLTVQVKTNLAPKPAGGRGKLSLDWWVPEASPAELFAFVDVSENRAWLFNRRQLRKSAQQKSPKGKLHLCMYTDPSANPRQNSKPRLVHQFESFRLENQIHVFF